MKKRITERNKREDNLILPLSRIRHIHTRRKQLFDARAGG